MKVLITGASGFLGRALAVHLARDHEVSGTCLSVADPIPGCRLSRLDISDAAAAERFVAELRPDAVVHMAAIASPDACARAPELAMRVNVHGTEAVARGCARAGARLILFSTDLVYDGSRPPYREGDEPRPMNHYARTKLEAEEVSGRLCPDRWALRFALGYGWKSAGRPGFTDNLYRDLSEGRRVRLFKDQFRTPTYIGDAVEILRRLLEMRSAPGGMFHFAGPERVDRVTFGRTLCEVFGLDATLIDPVSMEDVPADAYRPKDCSLDGSRLWRLTGYSPVDIRRGLQALRQEKSRS